MILILKQLFRFSQQISQSSLKIQNITEQFIGKRNHFLVERIGRYDKKRLILQSFYYRAL